MKLVIGTTVPSPLSWLVTNLDLNLCCCCRTVGSSGIFRSGTRTGSHDALTINPSNTAASMTFMMANAPGPSKKRCDLNQCPVQLRDPYTVQYHINCSIHFIYSKLVGRGYL